MRLESTLFYFCYHLLIEDPSLLASLIAYEDWKLRPPLLTFLSRSEAAVITFSGLGPRIARIVAQEYWKLHKDSAFMRLDPQIGA